MTGMGITMSKSVRIENGKLMVLNYILSFFAIVYCVYDFISTQKFFTILENTPQTQLTSNIDSWWPPIQELPPKTRDPMHRLCYDGDQNVSFIDTTGSFLNTSYWVRCLDPCGSVSLVGSYEPCLMKTNLVKNEGVQSLFTTLLEIDDVRVLGGVSTRQITYHIHAVAEYISYTFQFQLTLDTAEIPFFFGRNSAERVPSKVNSQDCVKVVIDKDGIPVSGLVFQPGSFATVPGPTLLYLAMQRSVNEKLFDSQPYTAGLLALLSKEFSNKEGDMLRYPGLVYSTGAAIDVEVSCFTRTHDLKQYTRSSNYDWGQFRADARKPVCLLSVNMRMDASDRVESSKVLGPPSAYPPMIQEKYAAGIHIRVVNGRSYHRLPYTGQFLAFITSALVLLATPKTFIRYLATNFLGHLSHLYKVALVQEYDVEDQCARTVMQMIAGGQSFLAIADVPAGTDGLGAELSKRRTKECLELSTNYKASCLDEGELDVLAEFGHRSLHRNRKKAIDQQLSTLSRELQVTSSSTSEDSAAHSLNIDQFLRRTVNENLDIDAIVKLFDKDRKRSKLEKIFSPVQLIKAIEESRAAKPIKNHSPAITPNGPTQDVSKIDDILNRIADLENTVQTLKEEVRELTQTKTTTNAITSPHLTSEFAGQAHSANVDLESRIAWLERVVGGIHDTTEEEEVALSFEAEFLTSLQEFRKSQEKRYRETVKCKLRCDDVTMVCTEHDGRTSVVTSAIGFVSQDSADHACSLVQNDLIRDSVDQGPQHVSSLVDCTIRKHRPSHWLRLCRQEQKSQVPGDSLPQLGSNCEESKDFADGLTSKQVQVDTMPLLPVEPVRNGPNSNSSIQSQIDELRYKHEQQSSYHEEQLDEMHHASFRVDVLLANVDQRLKALEQDYK